MDLVSLTTPHSELNPPFQPQLLLPVDVNSLATPPPIDWWVCCLGFTKNDKEFLKSGNWLNDHHISCTVFDLPTLLAYRRTLMSAVGYHTLFFPNEVRQCTNSELQWILRVHSTTGCGSDGICA